MEQIIRVDTDDNETGIIEKLEAHRKPILHRAFSVFLVDGEYMLLQRRAKNKYHSGNLWANACCSHPRPNKSFLDSVYSRLEMELGIKEKLELTEVFSFTYLSKFTEDLYEYEFDHVLVGRYDKTSIINFNKDEIEEVRWVRISHLKQDLLDNPNSYATWFVICAPKVIKYLGY